MAYRKSAELPDDSPLHEIVRELNLLASKEDRYIVEENGELHFREKNKGDDNALDGRDKLENLLLYLDMIGVGTEYGSVRNRIEKRLHQALKEEYASKRAVEHKSLVSLRLGRVSGISNEAHHAEKDVFEPKSKGKDYYALFEDKKKGISVYYYSPKKKSEEDKEGFYVYTPSGLTVQRASESELGKGVLGVAYIGLNLIKILDTLYGKDFEEVKKHEVLHHQYPNMPEGWIRKKTSEELPYQTKYQ